MADTPNHLGTSKLVLEPIERISEVLFGVVMVLTYTTAIAVGKDADDAVHHHAHWRESSPSTNPG